MRKIFVFMVLMLFTVTLSACDLIGGDVQDIIDEVTNIENAFTVEDQTIVVGSEEQDWTALVGVLNSELLEGFTVTVEEDNVDYNTVGTYTVTIRVVGPDVDFTRTFTVTVEEVSESDLSIEQIIAQFDGDVAYLSTLMDPVMNSETKKTVTTVELVANEVDEFTNEVTTHSLTMVSTTQIDTSGTFDVMHQELLINVDGELMEFDFYLVRQDDSLTLYLESSLIELVSGDPLLAGQLGITEEHMALIIPGDFTTDNGFDLSVILTGIEGYIGTLMTDLSIEEYQMMKPQIDYVVQNIDIFAKYLTLEYYMAQDGMTAQLSTNENNELVANMTMATTMYSTVLDELVTDIQTFANGLGGMQIPTDIKSQPEYQQLLTILNGLQPLEMDAVFDPLNPTEVVFSLDLKTFVNTLAVMMSGGMMGTGPIETLTMTIVVSNAVDITLPTEAASLNTIIPELAKIGFVENTTYSIYGIIDYFAWQELESPFIVDTEVSLTELSLMMEFYYDDYLFDATLFDQDLSYIVNRGTAELPMYYFQLVWVDGQNVFVREISPDEVFMLTNETQGYNEILELVNHDAFDYRSFANLLK